MYLKRSDSPRTVKLPDGSVMTRADLPPQKTTRWVASRKAQVVRAVEAGLIEMDEACEMYGLSEEELTSWRAAMGAHGASALKATALQKYRHLEQGSDTLSGK